MKINRARALARTELVGVRKRIFQHFHHRNNTGRLVFDAFNRRANFTQIGEQESYATATFRKLQCGIYRAANRLHIVFNSQQEAGHQFAALHFPAVQKSGRGRLESAAEHLIHQLHGEVFVTLRQC